MINLRLPQDDLVILCLGAHCDDIEIGCGATILRLAESRSVTAYNVVLTDSPERSEEATAAGVAFWAGADYHEARIGLPDGRLPAWWSEAKDALEDIAVEIRPHLILAPRIDDSHQDHRVVGELARTVWRDSLILAYEIPKWDGDLRPVTHYVPVSEDVARRKVELLDKCFPSQTARDWWDEETFLGLMRLRGVECRARYAEGFIAQKVTVGL